MEMFVKIKRRKYRKYGQRNDFLCYFKLGNSKVVTSDAISRYQQAVFKKGNTPANQNDSPYSGIFVF